MKEFKELLDVAKILNSPGGCPWDLKQTFESLRPYVLEEAHEVLEAVDEGSDDDIIEELGDLFYTVIFYAKVAEREKRFSLGDVIDTLRTKLVRRHPHVFGDEKNDMETIVSNWEKIKKEEKPARKSPLDGIPKTLPSLQRACKILKRMKKHQSSFEKNEPSSRPEQIAEQMLSLVEQAVSEGIDIESAFRKALSKREKHLQSSQL